MPRHYGLGHYRTLPKPGPRLARLLIVVGIGAAVGIAAVWQAQAQAVTCNQLGCSDRPDVNGEARNFSARRHVDANGNGVVVGGRPKGCPHKYCGCSASLYVFGEIRPMLNVARNWRVLFPHTSPAPGKVAVRTHHVFVLIRHVSGDRWMAHDGNSGGGLTRKWVRSIRGYTIVDPHGGKTAAR